MSSRTGLFLADEEPFEPVPDAGLTSSVEAELGVRLPPSFIDLCLMHNGGHLARNAHPATMPTTWADDHVAITSIAAIGRTARFSLCGEVGSAFWVREWGYPDIGVYVADCPSAGHDMTALDYRSGSEPSVVHVDQEADYAITLLAPDFATFLDGLVPEDDFP